MIDLPTYDYDEVELQAAAPLSGYAPITSHSRYGHAAGPIFETLEDDKRIRAFRVMEKHSNTVGICHGGMLTTFADIIMGSAVFFETGTAGFTVNMQNNFVGAAKVGDWVMGEATIERITNNLVFLSYRIYTDEKMICHGTGIFKRRV